MIMAIALLISNICWAVCWVYQWRDNKAIDDMLELIVSLLEKEQKPCANNS